MDDSLDDVKAITQVVGYAANNGIVWCILTNGIKWRVYRSVEKCPAPEKLMFELNLDPDASEAMAVDQIAKQMWRFSSEEMAKGTLDSLGEQIFTDGKVRKALDALMTDAPRNFLNLVRRAAGDDQLTTLRIKESLKRIACESSTGDLSIVSMRSPEYDTLKPAPHARSGDAARAGERRRAKKGESPCDEAHHLAGKPQEVIQLYLAIDRLCMSFAPSGVTRRYLQKYISYEYHKRSFFSVHVQQGGLRAWTHLKYANIDNPPSFARDVSKVGHWGTGDVELRISNRAELEIASVLIRKSFEAIELKAANRA